jgi:hypothetical protein
MRGRCSGFRDTVFGRPARRIAAMVPLALAIATSGATWAALFWSMWRPRPILHKSMIPRRGHRVSEGTMLRSSRHLRARLY